VTHIFRADTQPATRYRIDIGGWSLWLRNPRRRLIYAACCRRRRIARNLSVRAYYDDHRFTCVDGKGCKS